MIRNRLFLILSIFLLSVTVLLSIFFYKNTPYSPVPNIATPTLPPTKQFSPDAVEWTEFAKWEDIPKPKGSSFGVKGPNSLINLRGTISEIKDQRNYTVTLTSGENLSVFIANDTFVGQAKFGYTQDGVISDVNYHPLPINTLSSLQSGQAVFISYLYKNYSLTKSIPLTEFVLFELKK